MVCLLDIALQLYNCKANRENKRHCIQRKENLREEYKVCIEASCNLLVVVNV